MVRVGGIDAPEGYLIRNASFLSFPAFISSRIHTGVAPRPAQVSFGSFLLRYFGATFRPFTDFRRPLPYCPPFPIRASWLLSASAFFERTALISSRSFSSVSTDMEARDLFARLAMAPLPQKTTAYTSLIA